MSRKKIDDGLTKQQRYQARKKEKGLCIICGKRKTEQSLCSFCSKKYTNRKHYNKNKELEEKRNDIVKRINEILLSSNNLPLKMNFVYNKIIEEMKLKCSSATIRKYWLERKT